MGSNSGPYTKAYTWSPTLLNLGSGVIGFFISSNSHLIKPDCSWLDHFAADHLWRAAPLRYSLQNLIRLVFDGLVLQYPLFPHWSKPSRLYALIFGLHPLSSNGGIMQPVPRDVILLLRADGEFLEVGLEVFFFQLRSTVSKGQLPGCWHIWLCGKDQIEPIRTWNRAPKMQWNDVKNWQWNNKKKRREKKKTTQERM